MSEARVMRQLQEMAGGTAYEQGYSRQLQSKWNKGLKGIKHPHVRANMAALYENQATALRSLHEETLSTGVGSFTKYIFPILRRVFPNLIANNIVSVQPMTAPIGGVFNYEYKYNSDKGGDGVAGGLKDKNMIEIFNRWYTSEFIDFETLVASGAAVATVNGTLKWIPVFPLNASREHVTTVTTGVNGDAVVLTADASDNFVAVTDPGTHFVSGTINRTTGAIALDLSGGVGANTDADTTVSYYYDAEKVAFTDNAQLPSKRLELALTPIQAKTRALIYQWSADAADDFRALHGLDAETELVAGASSEISLELDREIIMNLVDGAAHTATWNYAPAGWAAGGTHNELEAIRNLLTKIDMISGQIHKETKRAKANFIVCSTEIGALMGQLTSHGDFVAAGPATVTPDSYGAMTSQFGVTRIGTLKNKYAVYEDPYLDANTCLVGLKGRSFLDAGYVYAPYVPLEITSTFQDPKDFSYRKGMRTRYATKMLRNEFYGVVTASNIPTVAT